MKDFKKKTKNKSIKKYRTCKKNDIKCQKELVLDLLRDTPFPKNTSRKNIMRTKHKENKARYEGFVLGKINLIPHMWKKDKKGKVIKQQQSNRTKDPRFKKLFYECKKLMKIHDPKFEFTTIQYNKNMRAARHVDGRNVGTSYIVGLGDYTGGELIVYDNAKKPTGAVKNDLRGNFYSFNGSKFLHEVAPFKGERYTIVFFKI
uniref:Fe2OG dioxygenase domain-containing protein n=1 Tax=viral metagenome TaxID=1070528 RepID=A0A6C0C4T1_9ZZZZ